MKKILYILFLFLISSCYDSKTELVEDMYFIQEGKDYNFIIYKDRIFLYPNVTKIEQFESKIVFFQNINKDLSKEMIELGTSSLKENYNGKIDSIINNQLNTSNQFKYEEAIWLFDKQKNELIGPFKHNEYLIVKKQFNLNDK